MGRSRLEVALVPLERAASILKVSETTVTAWVEKGLLEEVESEGKPFYQTEQLEGLARLLPKRDPNDIGTLAARADLAYARSLNTEERLNALCDLLGLNRNTLDFREHSVRSLVQTVEEALLEAEPPTLEDVRQWAGTFFAIDEAYLLLVEQYVATDEPWKKFMDLGYKLVVEAPYGCFDDEPQYRQAYGYLNAARTQLRSVAFFYCREHYGRQTAQQVFGDGRVTERVMGLLYPH